MPTSTIDKAALAARWRQMRTALGLGPKAMGTELGVTRQTINNIESGANAPSRDLMERAAGAFGVDINWIRFGKGMLVITAGAADPHEPENQNRSAANTALALTPDDAEFITIPYFDNTALGGFAATCHQSQRVREVEFASITILKRAGYDYTNAVALEIKGDSMAPKWPSRTVVVVRPVSDGNWQYARGVHAVSTKDGLFVIKRVIAASSQALTLASDNVMMPDQLTVPLERINCLWKVGEKVFEPEED